MKMNLRGPFGHITAIPSHLKPWNAVLKSHPCPVSSPIKARVAIVGSGIAAAVLAYELSKVGASVDVYESEKRLGGRIHTIRFPDNQYGELGAMRVPSNHAAVIDYIQELGLPTRPFVNWDSEGTIYFRDAYLKVTQKNGPSEQYYQSIRNIFPNIRKSFYKEIANGVNSAIQSLIVYQILKNFHRSTDSIDILLHPHMRNQKIAKLMETTLADFATGPECQLSEDEWLLLSRVSGMAAFNTCPVQQFILGMLPVLDSEKIFEVNGGMDALVEGLFSKAKSTNRFTQHKVISLERKQDKVELSFVKNHPPECRSCEYDHVVITVPPKSLGQIKISSDTAVP